MGAAGSSGMDVQTNGAASPHTEHSAASQLNRAPHSRHGRLRRRRISAEMLLGGWAAKFHIFFQL